MNWIPGFLRSVIEIGVVLALSHGIVRATADLAKKAAQAHTVGLVSLSKLNRGLVGTNASFARPETHSKR